MLDEKIAFPGTLSMSKDTLLLLGNARIHTLAKSVKHDQIKPHESCDIKDSHFSCCHNSPYGIAIAIMDSKTYLQ